MVKGIVIQFRRGKKRYHKRHFLLDFGLKTKEEASKLAGKDVEWKSPANKIIKGKISASHGNKGLVRAIFEIGLPGQALTTDVELKGEIAKETKPEPKEIKKKAKEKAK